MAPEPHDPPPAETNATVPIENKTITVLVMPTNYSNLAPEASD